LGEFYFVSLIVNLDEFAELVGVTAETMRVHIRAIEGEPVWLIKRGDRGRGYEIEAEGAVAWWKSKQEADELADAERREQLKQMRLDLVGGDIESGDSMGLSGKQRREEYGAAFEALKLRKTMGRLLDFDEMEHQLTLATVDLRRRLMLLPGEFCVGQSLDSKYASPLKALLGRALDDFVDALKLPEPQDADRN
jgi:hypothetical protein